MKKKRERDWLPVTVLLLTVLLLVLCLVGFDHHEPDGPDGNGKAAESELSADELQVTFFDVGKSDAILVEQSGYRMLIDTSFDDQADVLLDYFAERGIDTLDYLIITHFDKDHVGGADKILDAMHVKRVLEPDYTVEKKQFREYREALIRNRITAMRITDVERRSLGRASFIIYPPEEKDYDGNDNDLSLVLSLRYGTQSFLHRRQRAVAPDRADGADGSEPASYSSEDAPSWHQGKEHDCLSGSGKAGCRSGHLQK